MNGICPSCQAVVNFDGIMPFSWVNCPNCNTRLIVPLIYNKYQLVSIEEEYTIFKKYKGFDLESDCQVFVTILNKKFSHFRECLSCCKTEAMELKSKLNFEGVNPILEYGTHDNTFYLAEPCYNSFKLSEYDYQVLGEFDADSVFNVFKAVGNIIKEAHKKNIIHHNICPENILIDNDGNIKLQNFFISRVIYNYESVNRIKSSVSPFYISPEKAETGVEKEQGDVFSLGVTLYYILTGTYPFDGETEEEIVNLRIKRRGHRRVVAEQDDIYKEPVPVDKLRNDIAPEYSEYIGKMLKPVPIQRPRATKLAFQFDVIKNELNMQQSKTFDECFSNIITDNIIEKSKLYKAIEANKLLLHYQPIVNLKDNKISGFEALLRWPHESRNDDLPANIIPKISDKGEVEKLGMWVVDTACKQLSEWRNKGFDDLYIIVNISPEQIENRMFKENFVSIVKKYDLDRKMIIPEISKLSSYKQTNLPIECYEDFLTYFNSRLTLNEITSGYKDLQSKIGKLKIHSLVIDNDYLKNIKDTEENFQVFQKIIAFANSAMINTVAEKIETEKQAAFVKKIGCTFAQGYYFYRPLTSGKATMILKNLA